MTAPPPPPRAHKHTRFMVLPTDEYTYMGPPMCPLEITKFKVARPSIFVGTPSIFESLILKQTDLYRKIHHNTCITHRLYYFLGDQNKCHVTMASQ